MPNTKPFVAAAVLCEKVLVDEEGVPSLIRVVDTYKIDLPKELPAGTGAVAKFTAFFAIRSGDVVGKSELSIKLRNPDGKVVNIPQKWPVLLGGNEQGANLKLEFGLPIVYGLYWLDLYWNGDLLTSAPFRLGPMSPATPPTGAS